MKPSTSLRGGEEREKLEDAMRQEGSRRREGDRFTADTRNNSVDCEFYSRKLSETFDRVPARVNPRGLIFVVQSVCLIVLR